MKSANARILPVLALLAGISLAATDAAATSASYAPTLAASAAAHVPGPAAGAAGQRALRVAADPALAAIRQMRVMERIYLRQNQPQEAERMYREVLGRTQNTLIRNVVNNRLARLAAWQPRDFDAAMVELKRGLDENLSKVQ